VIASERWPDAGVPANPRAWLATTARNRAIDRIRRERTLTERIHLSPEPEATMDEFDDTLIRDERLRLIFTCCHPALPLDGQVALTLRALGGLETAEIARAFLVSEETMKRRLTRAKAKIKATGDEPPRPPAGPIRRRGPRAPRRPGPIAVGHPPDRGRTGRARSGDQAGWPRGVRRPGRDRVAADAGADRLAAGRGAVPAAGGAHRFSRGRAQPCRGGRPGGRHRGGVCAVSTPSTSTATSTSTPRVASCCAGSVAGTRPETRTAARWTSPPRPPSGGS
jgi:RNA polymerase sigma factor (sigma-70 family)